MKRAFLIMTLGLVAVAMTGCNRGWPSMFCNNDCGYEVIEECDPCASCPGGAVMGGSWSSAPQVETLPGPAST
ncbi:MAG: hypothetical protein KJ000_04765 [Pirellulaceae bacterium]|nr:hypothetical protein [Pirellulaceae bacterium]